jgi:hypothetical protein
MLTSIVTVPSPIVSSVPSSPTTSTSQGWSAALAAAGVTAGV